MKALLLILTCVASYAQSFPNSVYSPLQARDNIQTTLAVAMSSGDGVAFVASSTGWVVNSVAYICDTATGARCTGTFEVMLVTAVNPNALTMTRGYGGTSAISHASGKAVLLAPTAVYVNSLGSEIAAVEKFGGSGRYVDIRNYGAVCDGTSVQTAAAAAIAAGFRSLFIPAGCVWIPTANTLPDHITLLGENWETSLLQSSDPSVTDLTMGANSTYYNVGIKALNCTSVPPSGVKVCPVRQITNMGDTGYPIGIYPREVLSFVTGSSLGSTDRVAIAGTQTGIGDAIFLGATGVNSVGLRTWPIGNNSIGVFSQPGVTGSPTGVIGVAVYNYTNDAASRGLFINRIGNAVGMLVTDAGSTSGDMVELVSSGKATDAFVNVFHNTSAYTGNVLTVNMAAGSGSFAGNFETFSVNSGLKWSVSSQGIPTTAPMAYGSLPACAAGTEGSMAGVNNSNTITWGATVAAGGANHVLAYCDGTNWTVAGK